MTAEETLTSSHQERENFVLSHAGGALPWLGHAPALLRDPLGFLASLPRHGDLVWIRIGPVKALVVCHPELTHRMLLTPRIFEKGGPFYTRAREFMGNGLAVCPCSDHSRQRRMLQPAFGHNRFPAYASIVSEQFEAGTRSWLDGQILEVHPALVALTREFSARTICNAPGAAGELTELLDVIDDVLQGTYRRMLTPPPLDRLPTPGKRRYDRAIGRLHEMGLLHE